VQTFIAAARSSRDLTYGSQLLSELAKTTARTIAEQHGSSPEVLVLPAIQIMDDLRPRSSLNVANKVVAVVTGDVRALAEEIKAKIHEYVEQERAVVLKSISGQVDEDLMRRQLHDLIEFYWVAAPLPSEEQYLEVRERCDQALAARKVTRDFSQFPGVPRFKSSIDGVREHVMLEVGDKRSAASMEVLRKYGARRGELLSGVDLLKRWGTLSDSQGFKSTSHMAALPFMKGLGEQAENLRRELVALFERHGVTDVIQDYSVVFSSEVRSMFSDEQLIKRLIQEQDGLIGRYAEECWGRERRNRRPAPYYALLLADGDNMGKVLDEQKTPEMHRMLSQALSNLALEARRIIQEHEGAPVYVGGDDILAYLPLHTALKCVDELAERFEQAMQGFGFKADGETIMPTLSAGLLIAHHLEPLSEVLSWLRSTERDAKQVDGKNALAISLVKRSGVERQVKGLRKALIERLKQMVTWWTDGTLSRGTPYEFQELAQSLGDVLPQEALVAEAKRILGRKRESRGQEVSEEVRKTIEEWLTKDQVPLAQLAHEMIIAAEFADAKELANHLTKTRGKADENMAHRTT
jgi:CRISPR-associated protein Cmr2